jgi:LDH2 family malate/lactate/ureidoglycolate dehydrogenase
VRSVTEACHSLPVQELERWARGALTAAGAADEPASVTARLLVDANRRGLDTHGVLLLRLYLPRLASGAMDGSAHPVVARDLPAAAVVDGMNALGPYVASFALELCCEKARRSGAAAVSVRNSNHFGAASCFAEAAARQECLAIVCSNSDPGMAPEGALEPVLGTNPIAIAAPAGPLDHLPSLDFATSTVAVGRIRAAERAGQAIPPGWAIGPDGRPTEDPAEAMRGSALPMGGHKGFALAFMLDVLSGCLPGAAISPEISDDPEGSVPQGTGHFIAAVHLPSLSAPEVYAERLGSLARAVHGARRAPGVPAFQLPGEPEAVSARMRKGSIPFDEPSLALLRGLGERFGVPFP